MTQRYNDTIARYFGRAITPGEVGIEIELEGYNLPETVQYYWETHADGSLRPPPGGTAQEFVLRRPVNRGDVPKVLKYLEGKLKDSKIVHGPRASVHVHINHGFKTFQELFKTIVCYSIVEDALVHFCGEERIGNMFCLRMRDAEYLPSMIGMCIRNDNYLNFRAGDNVRYSALNVAALAKFGSVEFRTMRSTTDMALIETWVNILLELCDRSCSMWENPQDVIMDFSSLGPEEFLRKLFPKHHKVLLHDGWQASMQYGMRIAQDIAFARPSWIKPSKQAEKVSVAADDDTVGSDAFVVLDDMDDGGPVATGAPQPVPAGFGAVWQQYAGPAVQANTANILHTMPFADAAPPVGQPPPLGGINAGGANAAAGPQLPPGLPITPAQTAAFLDQGVRRAGAWHNGVRRWPDGRAMEPNWVAIPATVQRVICRNRLWERPAGIPGV